jgi:hypothetical protein
MVANKAVFFSKLEEKGLKVATDTTKTRDMAAQEVETSDMVHLQAQARSGRLLISLWHTLSIYLLMMSPESQVQQQLLELHRPMLVLHSHMWD